MIKYVQYDDTCLLEEEISGYGYSKPTYRFWPLKQYRLTDPCENCLVRACCRTWCDEKYRNVYFHRWINHFKSSLIRKLKHEKAEMLVVTMLYGTAALGIGFILLMLLCFISIALGAL